MLSGMNPTNINPIDMQIGKTMQGNHQRIRYDRALKVTLINIRPININILFLLSFYVHFTFLFQVNTPLIYSIIYIFKWICNIILGVIKLIHWHWESVLYWGYDPNICTHGESLREWIVGKLQAEDNQDVLTFYVLG